MSQHLAHLNVNIAISGSAHCANANSCSEFCVVRHGNAHRQLKVKLLCIVDLLKGDCPDESKRKKVSFHGIQYIFLLVSPNEGLLDVCNTESYNNYLTSALASVLLASCSQCILPQRVSLSVRKLRHVLDFLSLF